MTILILLFLIYTPQSIACTNEAFLINIGEVPRIQDRTEEIKREEEERRKREEEEAVIRESILNEESDLEETTTPSKPATNPEWDIN